MNRLFILLSLFVVATSCYNDNIDSVASSGDTSSDSSYSQHSSAIDGKLAILVNEELGEQLENMVTTKAAITDVLTSETLAAAGITKIERMFPYAGQFEARTRAEGMHLWYNVTFDTATPNTRVANGFLELDGVVKVQDKLKVKSMGEKPTILPLKKLPATKSESDYTFDDPHYNLNYQWHYKNDASVDGFVKGMDINIEPVWMDGVTGNPAVVVAIVDGGIDLAHEDIIESMYINENEIAGNGIDDDNNGYIDDIYGYNFVSLTGSISAHDHGTHVAGIVAARNNNGIGVRGIAGGDGTADSGVRLISCQMLETDESTGYDDSGEDEAAALAIKYGADNGAIISQNSWGYDSDIMMDYDLQAIDYFVKYAGIDKDGNQVGPMKGGIVIFAAGNYSTTYSNPGEHPTAVCVTAISPNGAMAPYSNYGEWAELAAPGGDQNSWDAYVGGVYSTIRWNYYQYDDGTYANYGSLTGTSMACPHVSGTVALYLSKMYEEGKHVGLTPQTVIDRLLNTTRSLVETEPVYYSLMGTGLLDAARFVGIETDTTPEAVTDLSICESQYTSIRLEWSVPSNAIGYTVFCSEESLDGVDFDNLPDYVNSLDVNKFADEDGMMRYYVSDLMPLTTYNMAIRSWDYGDNVSSVSSAISGTTIANEIPEFYRDGVFIDGVDELELAPDGQLKLSYEIIDPEGADYTYTMVNGSSAETVSYNSTTRILTVYIVASRVSIGTYDATVTATDAYDGVAQMIIRYTINENEAPVVANPIEDVKFSSIDESMNISLDSVFADNDSTTALTYSVSTSDSSTISATVSGSTLTLKSKSYGAATITVTATDSMGDSVTHAFTATCSLNDGQYTVSLYPNPVRTNLYISANATSIDEIAIYNSRGAKVLSGQNLKASCELDLSSLSTGVYSVDVIIDGTSNVNTITKL